MPNLTYQELSYKCKVHDGSLVYYHKTQNSATPTKEANTISTVKYKRKAATTAGNIGTLTRLVLMQTETSERPVVNTT